MIRSTVVSFLLVFTVVTTSFGQGYVPPGVPTSGVAASSQPVAQHPNRQQPTQQQQIQQQQPIQMQTMQTPPKTVLHNGITVYQQGTQPSGQAPSDRTMPAGFGSPYPTGTLKVASTQAPQNRQNGTVYGLPPVNDPNARPVAPAAQHAVGEPAVAARAPGAPGVSGTVPTTATPPTTTPERNRVHMGRAEPVQRVMPFLLNPQEQKELDELLVRWEKYSEKIKRFDVDFTSYLYDPTIQRAGAEEDPNKPVQTTFGYFKYIAPSRFVYHVEGEWINGAKVKRDEKERPQIIEEKIIIDEKTVYYFDVNAKKVRQINIPPELIGRGIADSPLPLIFGAKADEMKKRFSLKIVTSEQYKDSQIWLLARPLTREDQQEFQQIEIRLDKKTLRAVALKKDENNKKAYTVYVLNDPKINPPFENIIEIVKQFFNPTIPKGWVHIVEDMTLLQAEREVSPQQQPAPVPAIPRGNVAQPGPRQEIQLYTPSNN